MKAVGIICEYNPLHNGHVYHIKKVREMFPNHILVLVLNGYFLERGEISLLSKRDKTKLALDYGVDLVVSLPVFFGTQAADIFAKTALSILNHLRVSEVVFGSESNNLAILMEAAKLQLDGGYSNRVKQYLDLGINFPTALAKACNITIKEPNDLLGISYCKAILENHYDISLHTIKRTNSYYNNDEDSLFLSAHTIRNKIKQNQDVSNYVPNEVDTFLKAVDSSKVWSFLKFRILTENHLEKYLTVDEGIESRLKKMVVQADSLEDFIKLVKTKRYTYNKIQRMIVHILLGITKDLNQFITLDYLSVLGFNLKGQKYLHAIRKSLTLPLKNNKSKLYQIELIAAYLYDEFTNSSERIFELEQKPIQK